MTPPEGVRRAEGTRRWGGWVIGHSVVSICWNNNLRTLTSRRRRRRRGFSLLQWTGWRAPRWCQDFAETVTHVFAKSEKVVFFVVSWYFVILWYWGWFVEVAQLFWGPPWVGVCGKLRSKRYVVTRKSWHIWRTICNLQELWMYMRLTSSQSFQIQVTILQFSIYFNISRRFLEYWTKAVLLDCNLVNNRMYKSKYQVKTIKIQWLRRFLSIWNLLNIQH